MNIPALAVETVSLAASFVIYSQKPAVPYLRFFPAFLFITVVVEIIASQLTANRINTGPYYSYFTAFEFEFYLFTISLIIVRKGMKKLIYLVMVIYPLATIYNINFGQRDTFASITFAVGCLLIVAGSIYYFLELFQFPKAVNLLKEPAFWICSSLLFFYCCTFPLIGMFNYVRKVSPVIMLHLNFILTYLNVLLYSLFTIAFLCKIKIRRPVSQIPA